jgi:hypothetical protein
MALEAHVTFEEDVVWEVLENAKPAVGNQPAAA